MESMHGTILLSYILIGSPGRFFAVDMIKLMLIFVLLRYDIKTKDGKRPKDSHMGLARIPDMSVEILFRRRSNIISADPKLEPVYS